MTRAIDHIVIAVHDLDRTAAELESLGFTLTPRARHEDAMGTSNRLIQLADHAFLEILEVDRPETAVPHDLDASPRRFSFGAHNKAFLERGEGGSMIVFQSTDAAADNAHFNDIGAGFAPFGFERHATQPDGTVKTVAFDLAFAVSPDMPDLAFFTCHNRFPENFWKPDFQRHANGAIGIRSLMIETPDPDRDAAFLALMMRAEAEPTANGRRIACSPSQTIEFVRSDAGSSARITEIAVETGQAARAAPIAIGSVNIALVN